MSDAVTPAPASTDSYTLTPEQATAKLAEMAAALNPPPPPAPPANASDARRRLDALSRDPTWSQKFMSGNAEARREFAELTKRVAEGDPVADAMNTPEPVFRIDTTVGGEMPQRAIRDFIADARQAGISEGAIAQALRGEKVSPQEYEATKRFKQMRMSDPEWAKKLAAGDYQATQELRLMGIILAPWRQ